MLYLPTDSGYLLRHVRRDRLLNGQSPPSVEGYRAVRFDLYHIPLGPRGDEYGTSAGRPRESRVESLGLAGPNTSCSVSLCVVQVWKNSMYEPSERVPMMIAGPGMHANEPVRKPPYCI